jgi:hypothetical protein
MGDLAEIIAVVAVTHHQVLATRFTEAPEICCSISAAPLVNDTSAGPGRDFRRTVVRSIVDDDNFAGELERLNTLERLFHGLRDSRSLVETWNDN